MASMHQDGPRLVVAGGDAAGLSAAVQAKRSLPGLEVEVFEAGDYISYAACGMPYYLSGEVPDVAKLHADPQAFAKARGITVHTRTRVTGLDAERHSVQVQGPQEAREARYDQLVLATGVRPVTLPPFAPYAPEDGVFTLRGIEDIVRIRAALEQEPDGDVAIFGMGYVALEMAESLAKLKRRVTLVNIDDSLLSPGTHPKLKAHLRELLEGMGVGLEFGQAVQSVSREQGRFVMAFPEKQLTARFVLLGVGVRPVLDYLEGSGIVLGRGGGVAVDPFRRTNLPGVLAAGDMSEYEHGVTGEWGLMPLALPANRSGRVAGENVARILRGDPVLEPMPPVLGTAITRLGDYGFARTGFTGDALRGERVSHIYDTVRNRAHYMPDGAPTEIVLSLLQDGRLVGAQILGSVAEARRIDFFALAIAHRLGVKEVYDVDTSYAPPFSPVYSAAIKTAGKAAQGA